MGGAARPATTADFDELARRCLELGAVGDAEYDAATDAIARGRTSAAGVVALWAPRLQAAERALHSRAVAMASRAASEASVGGESCGSSSPRATPTDAAAAPPAPLAAGEEGPAGFLGSVKNLFAPAAPPSASASPLRPQLKREGSTSAAWVMLDAIKKELELPPGGSKQRTVQLALERCGLAPAATIAEDVVNVANFLELSAPIAALDV